MINKLFIEKLKLSDVKVGQRYIEPERSMVILTVAEINIEKDYIHLLFKDRKSIEKSIDSGDEALEGLTPEEYIKFLMNGVGESPPIDYFLKYYKRVK